MAESKDDKKHELDYPDAVGGEEEGSKSEEEDQKAATGGVPQSILDKFVAGLREVLPNLESKEKPAKVFEELNLENVAKFIREGTAKNIIVMTGAGVSTYTLEHVAGIPADKVIEAHGTFFTNHCLGCRKEFNMQWMRAQVFSESESVPRCDDCEQVVKPDIVFFGESLPERFFSSLIQDFPNCDLLIIMGTSLAVQPFAGIIGRVGESVPRLLINNTKVGQVGMMEKLLGISGLDFDEETGTRDIFWKGTCDDGCTELAKLLGWDKDLKELIEREWAKIDTAKDSKGITHKLDEQFVKHQVSEFSMEWNPNVELSFKCTVKCGR